MARKQGPNKRHAATSIRVDPNIRALSVYPIEGTERPMEELQTIGIRLSRDQAIHLARVLLAVTQEWDEVDITAKRFVRRTSDNTHPVTVTSRARNA
jgi:hypothetical protein